MKNVGSLLLSMMLCLLLVSCQTETDPITPDGNSDTPTPTGAVTPLGKPEGTATTATIGPAGGTVTSADQRIKITIPAGALTTSQSIAVQPVSNNCPAGTGQAFRLTPHGITFAKPAAITFQYSDADINGSAPEALRVAYQNDKGIWRSPSVKRIDTTAHTITVETTHFSDWGLFQNIFLSASNSMLNPGEKAQLDVVQVAENLPGDDELIIPLPTHLATKYIDKWSLTGEGNLTNQKNKGEYTAPARIPAVNPAAVTVFLNKTVTIDGKEYKDLRLMANFFVAPEGISVQIDGGDWKTYPGGANINPTQNVVLGQNGAEYASVGWIGASTGTFRWTKDSDVAFNVHKGTVIYQHLYGTAPSVSGGTLRVDNTDPTWVVGTFLVQPAGWINTDPKNFQMGTAKVNGVFRMKRVGAALQR